MKLAFKWADNGSQWCHCILTSKIIVHIYRKKDNYCCPLIKLFQLHPEELAITHPWVNFDVKRPTVEKKMAWRTPRKMGKWACLELTELHVHAHFMLCTIAQYTWFWYTGLSIYFPCSIKCIVTRGNSTASSGFSACQAKLAGGKSN